MTSVISENSAVSAGEIPNDEEIINRFSLNGGFIFDSFDVK